MEVKVIAGIGILENMVAVHQIQVTKCMIFKNSANIS